MKRLAICVLVSYLASCSPASGQGGIITTVAGSGATGHSNGSFSGDGGPTSATLAGPVDVAVDTSGNLFIADTYNSTQFVQQGAKLVGTGAVDSPDGPWEGYSVAVSGDGNTALVGGFQDNNFTGAVWTFTRSGSTWTQQGSKLAGGTLAYFGWSVALSSDGKTAIVGAPYSNYFGGGAWVYTLSGGVWTQQGSVLVGTGAVSGYPNGSFQGYSVSLSSDGNTAIIGGPNDNNFTGAAWVFTRSDGVWTQQGNKLVGTGAVGFSGQGSSAALSDDGNTAIVGGPDDNSPSGLGSAWVFTRSGSVWAQQGKLDGGESVALSSDGNTAIVGGCSVVSATGSACVYTRSGETWTQSGSALVGSGAAGDAGQGDSVALSGDGETAIVGGPLDGGEFGTGAAWVFVASSPAAAAPSITSGGIVPVDSTVATIQAGEWVSIFGTNLSSATAAWNGDFPISLGGTSVTIDGKAAYLSYVSPTQINVQSPDDSSTGSVPVVVTTAGGTATSAVTLAQFAPSFLLLDSKHVAGIILRSNGSGAYGDGTYDILGPTGISLGYPTVAAKAGDTIALFALGLGPTSQTVPAGQAFSAATPTTYPVTLLVNNVTLAPIFSGLSGAGLYQINLTLPPGLGTGDVPLVAIVATAEGAQTPPNVVISLQ
jgi:uncharacterized protein (TIGR03437 family)